MIENSYVNYIISAISLRLKSLLSPAKVVKIAGTYQEVCEMKTLHVQKLLQSAKAAMGEIRE